MKTRYLARNIVLKNNSIRGTPIQLGNQLRARSEPQVSEVKTVTLYDYLLCLSKGEL